MGAIKTRAVDTVAGPVRVRPGDVNAPETQKAYREGQCTALAIELHKATGLPLIALADGPLFGRGIGEFNEETNFYDSIDAMALAYGFVHAAVLTTDGRVLDIAGARPLLEVLAEWDEEYLPENRTDDEDCECPTGCICTECCYSSANLALAYVTENVLHELWGRCEVGAEPDHRMAATMVAPLLEAAGLT